MIENYVIWGFLFLTEVIKKLPTSKEWWLQGRRRAARSYFTFKVRRGDLVQGKEQWLHFAGAAVKRYPNPR